MKNDFTDWANNCSPNKIISKETLNHSELIRFASGLNPNTDTPAAFREAYRNLGIDLINRVPLENAPTACAPGETRTHPSRPYTFQHLGVYDTAVRHSYECANPEDVWNLDVAALDYADLITPVPHPCIAEDIRQRETALGNIGCYYPMLYTTLFMWGVEVLGWDVFMMTAFAEPERFHDHFLMPCVRKSRQIVEEVAQASSCPFVFVHDDLASATGPVFPPSWYDDCIFPHYPEILAPAHEAGKQVCLVADGNMTAFLPKLVELGFDGIMYENPATPVDEVIEHFGKTGRFFIGGIDTAKLTFGTPEEIKKMVYELIDRTAEYPGFAMASCGGLHDSIPIENAIAYFDARADVGATAKNWKTEGET